MNTKSKLAIIGASVVSALIVGDRLIARWMRDQLTYPRDRGGR